VLRVFAEVMLLALPDIGMETCAAGAAAGVAGAAAGALFCMEADVAALFWASAGAAISAMAAPASRIEERIERSPFLPVVCMA
jgi:hypothetical protein